MSTQSCHHCGEPLLSRSAHCVACGAPAGAGILSPSTHPGLHAAAPLVFLLASLAIGLAITLSVSLAAGVPLGLLGGGLGVWVLERGRRLL
jgi:hypothetical protein